MSRDQVVPPNESMSRAPTDRLPRLDSDKRSSNITARGAERVGSMPGLGRGDSARDTATGVARSGRRGLTGLIVGESESPVSCVSARAARLARFGHFQVVRTEARDAGASASASR